MSSVLGRGGPTASGPPPTSPSLTPPTLPTHCQFPFLQHAELGPASGPLQQPCPPPESSLLRLFVWPAPFGQQNCHVRRKDFVPAHPEKATRQPLLNTFPSPRGVCVLGPRLFLSFSLFVCRPSKLPALATGWSQCDLSLPLSLCARWAIRPRIPSSYSITPVNPTLPFGFKTPNSGLPELSSIGQSPSPP